MDIRAKETTPTFKKMIDAARRDRYAREAKDVERFPEDVEEIPAAAEMPRAEDPPLAAGQTPSAEDEEIDVAIARLRDMDARISEQVNKIDEAEAEVQKL